MKGSDFLKVIKEASELIIDILTEEEKKQLFFLEKYGDDFNLNREVPTLTEEERK